MESSAGVPCSTGKKEERKKEKKKVGARLASNQAIRAQDLNQSVVSTAVALIAWDYRYSLLTSALCGRASKDGMFPFVIKRRISMQLRLATCHCDVATACSRCAEYRHSLELSSRSSSFVLRSQSNQKEGRRYGTWNTECSVYFVRCTVVRDLFVASRTAWRSRVARCKGSVEQGLGNSSSGLTAGARLPRRRLRGCPRPAAAQLVLPECCNSYVL